MKQYETKLKRRNVKDENAEWTKLVGHRTPVETNTRMMRALLNVVVDNIDIDAVAQARVPSGIPIS